MLMAQDKCPSNGHSPNVRNRTWDSPLPFLTNYEDISMGSDLTFLIGTAKRVMQYKG